MMVSCRIFLVSTLFLALLTSCGSSRKSRKTDPAEPENTGAKAFSTEYSRKLGVPVPENANQMLYSTLYNWMGVPYKYGGNTTKGVDCSGLICSVYREVYQKQVPRVSDQMYREARKVDEKDLKEGDILFFKINLFFSKNSLYIFKCSS